MMSHRWISWDGVKRMLWALIPALSISAAIVGTVQLAGCSSGAFQVRDAVALEQARQDVDQLSGSLRELAGSLQVAFDPGAGTFGAGVIDAIDRAGSTGQAGAQAASGQITEGGLSQDGASGIGAAIGSLLGPEGTALGGLAATLLWGIAERRRRRTLAALKQTVSGIDEHSRANGGADELKSKLVVSQDAATKLLVRTIKAQ